MSNYWTLLSFCADSILFDPGLLPIEFSRLYKMLPPDLQRGQYWGVRDKCFWAIEVHSLTLINGPYDRAISFTTVAGCNFVYRLAQALTKPSCETGNCCLNRPPNH